MGTRFRVGDYLIVDESSGFEIWASDASYDWDGAIRDARDLDGQHPDYIRRVYPAEIQPTMTNAPVAVSAYVSAVPIFVGGTTVTAQPGPAPDRFIV